MRRSRLLASRSAQSMLPPPPSAFAHFGERSVIGTPSRVEGARFTSIGDDVIINENAWLSVVAAVEGVTPRFIVGDGTRIDRLLHIACVGDIEIGRKVLMAERVLIEDTYHEYQDVTTPVIDQPMAPPMAVRIGDGAFLGIGVVIRHGVTVGENAYVGAGAVVTRDVPPRTVVVGNPARILRVWNETTGVWDRAQPESVETT
jgi:acetyltransferase-like isoleucine patch superfamily enzyme